MKELKDEMKRGGKGARAATGAGARGDDVARRPSPAVAAQSEAAATSLQLMETREALSFARMESDRLARQLAQRGDGGDDAAKELRARITGAEVEIKRLQNENADLRAELDALDPAFFDEVMEMKRAYHEQAEVLGTYEDLLRRYSSQLGVEFTPATRDAMRFAIIFAIATPPGGMCIRGIRIVRGLRSTRGAEEEASRSGNIDKRHQKTSLRRSTSLTLA